MPVHLIGDYDPPPPPTFRSTVTTPIVVTVEGDRSLDRARFDPGPPHVFAEHEAEVERRRQADEVAAAQRQARLDEAAARRRQRLDARR